MFTIEQIKAAHSKVKSGADFPNYIRDLKQSGVTAYETWVQDGHTDYSGANQFTLHSEPKYANLEIAATSNKDQFQQNLKAHQQGQTDYPTFCRHCAEAGIEKWIADLSAMSCTYFDKAGSVLLEEKIPG
ncbi:MULTISPECIES: DUF1398 domain-containing protein [Niastella]|uniref:DUF1398 domain-containing protein n=1 Tax=Niastella soli TaxID=2821487 RepID=A0ABS3YZH7_9BACT|nr:DUF1398 family protein [Niastella soli]MBO9203329.1 DUF1398 domain-containing protein [Niastella soli]